MQELQEERSEVALLGDSPAIQRVRERLRNAATTDAPVLLTGESGTGKDLAANLLHQWSRRRNHGFVKVNCPAIPGPLFESEVFGHEAGAFTGARKAKPGKFEQANHGTLFLDEIGELDMGLQSKLLHALQDFHVVRLGALDERKVDIRLVCATNRNLEAEIASGNFRADLFYRINVLKIEMPSLRERAGDIAVLLHHFVRYYGDLFNRRPEPVSSSFLRLLESYHWPGNIRELENLAKRFVVLGGEEHVVSSLREPEEFNPLSLDAIDINTPLRVQTKKAVQHLERRIILRVLQAHKWNRRKTARSLDISYRALLYKIKDAGLPPIRTVKTTARKLEAQSQEGFE
jgi:two-component system response regulator AtoC